MKAMIERNMNGIDVKAAGIEYGCQRHGIGRCTMRKLAEDANAVVKIGKRWLFNVQKVDQYINDLSK